MIIGFIVSVGVLGFVLRLVGVGRLGLVGVVGPGLAGLVGLIGLVGLLVRLAIGLLGLLCVIAIILGVVRGGPAGWSGLVSGRRGTFG